MGYSALHVIVLTVLFLLRVRGICVKRIFCVYSQKIKMKNSPVILILFHGKYLRSALIDVKMLRH